MVENYNYQSGFTLLELVLVLFILAVLTTTGLSFIENEDGQLRYNQSLEKLELIGDALLRERTHRTNTIYSGFVSDNGTIPTDIDLSPLTENNTDWSISGSDAWVTYNSILPRYYNQDTDDEIELDGTNNPEFVLFKGYRGPYLNTGLDANSEFKDGWGQDYVLFASGNTFDYAFDRDGGAILTTSIFYSASDITQTLGENEWTIDPDALNITIQNNSGVLVNANEYQVAIAVFINSAITGSNDNALWETFHFTQDASIADGNTYNSAVAVWEYGGGGAVGTERVPVGEHIALLVDINGGDDIEDGVAEITDSVRFTVFPDAANQPEIVLEIP